MRADFVGSFLRPQSVKNARQQFAAGAISAQQLKAVEDDPYMVLQEALEEIATQMRGIGGSRSIGFGAKRVTSLPDGLAHTFQEYLTEREERMEEQKLLDELRASHRKAPEISAESEKKPFEPATSPMLKIGDICPECGQATVINEEGCRKCYSCGYSEC